MGIISTLVKIFFVILGIIAGIVVIAYVFYLITRKDNTIGFQDFIIDTIFHRGNKPAPDSSSAPIIVKEQTNAVVQETLSPAQTPSTPTVVTTSSDDPLRSYVPPEVVTPVTTIETPVESAPPAAIPDWLKPAEQQDASPASTPDLLASEPTTPSTTPLDPTTPPVEDGSVSIPDWLKPPTETTDSTLVTPAITSEDVLAGTEGDSIPSSLTPTGEDAGELPDWLSAPSGDDVTPLVTDTTEAPAVSEAEGSMPLETPSPDAPPEETIIAPADSLPDWLIASAQESSEDADAPEAAREDEKDEVQDSLPAPATTPEVTPEKKSKSRKTPASKKKAPTSQKEAPAPAADKKKKTTTPEKKAEKSDQTPDIPDWLK